MRKLHVFDFDGTLTSKDSLVAFVVYCFGRRRFMEGLLMYFPLIFLMKMGILASHGVKQIFFSHYFKGMDYGHFSKLCEQFAEENTGILRTKAMETIRKIRERGERMVIVSASMPDWIRPFFDGFDMEIIGTEPEIKDGILTGKFATPNCRRQQKVERLRKSLPEVFGSKEIRKEWHVVAYGDSKGDREMFSAADEWNWKPFR